MSAEIHSGTREAGRLRRGSAADRHSGLASDSGTATAELAILMPAFVLLLVVLLTAGAAAVVQIQCIDAARTAARLAARGEAPGAVVAAGRASAPPGAAITVRSGGSRVTVEVSVPVRIPLPGFPGLRAHASSSADLESALAASATGTSG